MPEIPPQLFLPAPDHSRYVFYQKARHGFPARILKPEIAQAIMLGEDIEKNLSKIFNDIFGPDFHPHL